jgi:EAL domain-containing protein (putative c-di-GMP-specific phosphodiesterase class I)
MSSQISPSGNEQHGRSKPPQCAPSANGCQRCQAVSSGEIPANTSAILFGCGDADAAATLWQAFCGSGFDCQAFGPLLIVREIRDRLKQLASLLDAKLSLYTQSCIQAAYSPVGVESVDQALGAIAYAAPLSEMIENIEHEWIRTALKENWMFTVFHPIIHARTGQTYANEALLRARNPRENQVLGAGQIINACEKLNLTHQLDQRARQCAIQAASEHVPAASRVFINFLPNTIYDPEICLRTTMEAAAEHQVSMDRLVFEVVETEKIPDMAHLCKVLEYYRDRGVGTAIDDMGAGFTGTDYITSLRPNFVKLDREFVLAAEQTPAGRRAMDAMIGTSHTSGAQVIAEGIETTAQMDMCVAAGVDLLQGFLFAKPACPPQAVTFPNQSRKAA